jgi:hydroxymethylpyrimidine/phosphomethylpyrimidine kinase
MEEVGMGLAYADRKRYSDAGLEELTAYAIEKFGSVPDVIYDPGNGKDPRMVRMLGRDLEDLKEKIESIL